MKTKVDKEARTELHEKLSLTGAKISLKELHAGASVPFVHAHKENEEIYGILSGKGKVIIDGKEIILAAGDWLKISPVAKRQFFAANDSGITYICVQVKENSLEHFPQRMPSSADSNDPIAQTHSSRSGKTVRLFF